ncbi:MAG: hypothetical protein WEB50_09785 [Vicinamibacterales bacterium]
MRLHMQVAIGAAAVMLAVTGSAVAQQSSGAQPVLAMTAYSVAADGSTVASAGGDDPVVTGKAVTHYLYAGKAGQEGACTSGSADGPVTSLETLLTRAAHVWKVTATGVKYEAGKQTFDLAWQRYAAISGAVPVVSRKQRITLEQGQTFTVDLLHNTSPDCRTASVIVEIEAGMREDPVLADTLLYYDLWLVRRDASGQTETRHFVMMAKQGGAVPFEFPTLRSAIPKLQANQYDFELLSKIGGELRGRAGTDGRVAIELSTNRQDRLARTGSRLGVFPGFGAGRKILEVGWEEPVEIQLPSGTGYTSTYASAADEAAGKKSSGQAGRVKAGQGASGSMPAAPVSIQNGRLVVNYAAFFANETVSLILQVKKAGEAGGAPAVQ